MARSSSDNSAILPVLWMTSCFAHNGPYGASVIGRILKVTHQGAAPGAKRDVNDCTVAVVHTVRQGRNGGGAVTISQANAASQIM